MQLRLTFEGFEFRCGVAIMGIVGLWPLLEPTCQPVPLEALEGMVLAVDVSIWIYQAQLGYPGEVRCPHLALLVSRLCKLLYYKIRPVFVFDGMCVPSFKKKVLDERRLKKHADEVSLTRAKKRHLLDLASGSQSQLEIEAVKSKLAVENTKKQRLENNLFDILPAQPIETGEPSDEDDIVSMESRPFFPDTNRSSAINFLVEERERIRADRLKPSQIPTDSKTFSDFQLQRLLFRSRLNNQIQQLCENREGHSNEISMPFLDNTLYGQSPLFSLLHSDSQKSTSDDSDDGEFYSKTTMVEDHAKRSMGYRNAITVMLRSDDWSSDSGTEDFIDVPSIDLPFNHSLRLIETKQQSVKEVSDPTTSGAEKKYESNCSSDETTEHWEPALGEDFEWTNKEDVRNGAPGGRDSECYKDLQDFLTACGFPWVEAPGEAEAQCVQLEKLGLVQGVISDDSDVWAFGAKSVYRHLFSKNKNVQHYESRVIKQCLGLSQSEFVGIAVISGSDYSSGLTGIGVVTAIELLSEFAVTKSSVQSDSQEYETMRTLKNIGEWMVTFESNIDLPEPTSIRQKLRSVIMKNNDVDKIKSIVNDEVVAAYFHPNVDNSTEKFRWRSVDIDSVRHLLYNRLGWDDGKFERQTLLALQRWNDFIGGKTSYQRHITSYMHNLQQCPNEQKTKLTRRLETALVKLSKRTGSSSNIAVVSTESLKQKCPR
ncbi:hypothetical protein Angca_002822, partial [Angiostrongylus cantonensis]